MGVSATPTKALLQFLEGAADISSSVSHVRLATEAEVNCAPIKSNDYKSSENSGTDHDSSQII